MPLVNSPSRQAISENIRRETAVGKKQPQAVAIALDVQRRNRARGGLVARRDDGGAVTYTQGQSTDPIEDALLTKLTSLNASTDARSTIGHQLARVGLGLADRTYTGLRDTFAAPGDVMQGKYSMAQLPELAARTGAGIVNMSGGIGAAPEGALGFLAPRRFSPEMPKRPYDITHTLSNGYKIGRMNYEGAPTNTSKSVSHVLLSPNKEVPVLYGNSPVDLVKRGFPDDEHYPLLDEISRKRGGSVTRRDIGGSIDPETLGGVAPSAQTADPVTQAALQRYAGLPQEKLQDLMTRLPAGSQQAALVQRALRQKQTVPDVETQSFAIGGVSLPLGMPRQARVQSHASSGYGLLHSPFGAAGGRSDTLPHKLRPNSFVLPADFVSGLGQGDTASGHKVWQHTLNSMPNYGTPKPNKIATGGVAKGEEETVPVLVANGEITVSPEDAARFGEGDPRKGHAVLRAWVLHQRKKTIKDLKGLPAPVK